MRVIHRNEQRPNGAEAGHQPEDSVRCRKAISKLICLAADTEYTFRGCGCARQQLVSRPLIYAAHDRLEQLAK